jgi:PAS domain S-box-containing protein
MQANKTFLLVFYVVILLPGIIGFTPQTANAQGNLFIHHFLPNDYPGRTQNWGVTKDKNNVIWVANQDGVMSFNGNSWQLIKTEQNSTVRSMCFDENEKLYIGAISDLGYIDNTENTPKYVSLRNKIDNNINFTDVWSTVAIGDKVFFLTDNYLFVLYNDSITTHSRTHNYFYLAFDVDNTFMAQQIGSGLYTYTNKKLVKIKNSDFFANKKIHGIFEHNSRYLIATKNKGLYSVKMKKNFTEIMDIQPFHTSIDKDLKEHTIYKAKRICDNKFGFATTNNGFYITDESGKLVHHLNTESQLLTDAVYDFTCTRDGTVWLAQDMGLSIIETGLPTTHFDHTQGIKGAVSDIVSFKDRLYIATGFGLFQLNYKADYHNRKFTRVKNIRQQAWSLLNTRINNQEHLFLSAADGIYEIADNTTRKVFENTDTYVLYAHPERKNYIFAGTSNGLVLLKYQENKWEEIHKFGDVKHQVRDLKIDNSGNIWIAENYQGFLKLTKEDLDNLINFQIAPALQLRDTANGLGTLRDIQFYKRDDNLLFVAMPHLYSYEESTDRFNQIPESTQDMLRKTKDSSVLYIEKNILYFSKNNKLIIDSTTLKRLPYNVTNASLMDGDNIWIGTENGLYHYNTKITASAGNYLDILLHKYKAGNNKWQIIQNKNKTISKKLPYSDNTISVNVEIPFYFNHTANQVSFYLEGFDKQYEPWHRQFQKTYTNLSPGNYSLYVRGKNTFGNIISKKIMDIAIKPPLYRKPLAYFSYAIIWMLVMILAIRYRTKKLRKTSNKLELIVNERTQQLLDKNEEVMQVANILKENNQKLQQLSIVAEKAGNAVSIFDKSGELTWCNAAFETLYGYTIEEYKNQRGSTILKNSEYPHIRKAYEKCSSEKKSVQYEYFTLSKNHIGLWIHTTLTPVFEHDNHPEQYIAIDTNITQLKNAEEEVRFQKDELERKSKELADKNQELQKLSIIARETDNAVLLTDKEGQILWLNEGFTRLYGFTLADFQNEGENVFTISSNRKIKDYILNWPTKNSSITYESQNQTRSGEKIWAQTTLTPIKSTEGEIKQIIAIDSDITALKIAEVQIEKQRDQLKQLNATKDKFFSIIGHDLRSPFGNFVNMTNIIMQNISTADSQTLFNYVSKLHRSAQNSYNLLENLLDWARHQQRRIKFYPDFIDVTSIVEEMTEILLPLAERKKIHVELIYDEPIYAYFDEHMVKTVIRNLLFNALKFTPAKGSIKIYFDKTASMINTHIKDTGVGIKKEDREKLFRSDTHFSTIGTDKERGTGLGLMLSKDFVEMNKGTLSVQSVPGKGSTFTISLPKTPEE